MKSSNALLGVLGGLAAGAILGVLLAPDNGENTRKKIVDKSNSLKDDLKNNVDSIIDNISEKYDTIKSAGNEILSTTKRQANHVEREMTSNTTK